MLQAVTTSFGAFFALRFLLGTFPPMSEWGISWCEPWFSRHVWELCCSDFDSHYIYVLQEGWAGEDYCQPLHFFLLIHLRVNECRGFMWWCVCSFCHLNFIQIDFCQNGTHVPTWQSLRIQHSSRLNANIRGLRRIRSFILWWSPARTLQDHIFPAWWACNHRGTMCYLVAPRLSCARSVVDEGRKDCSAGASPWRPRWNRE